MVHMARKKNEDDPPKEPDVNATQGTSRSADRHKHKRMMRVPDVLANALDKLAERHDRPVSWELRRAIEAYLREHNALPPDYEQPNTED